MERLHGKELGKIIDDYVNVMGRRSDDDELVKYLTLCMHRYTQSEFIKLLKRLIQEYASAPTDGRNEYQVEDCKKITQFMEENYMILKK